MAILNFDRINRNWSLLFALALVLLGILLPANFFERLQSTNGEVSQALMAGGNLFKVGCIVLGLWIVIVRQLMKFTDTSDQTAHKSCLDQNTIFALTILMMVTIITRLYALNSGLWLDEILTYVGYATKPFGEIITTFDSENQHFLYSLLAHTSFSHFW